ncbi:MAG: MATE family efflux transporter, partial [Treponema sp.]|nr:MATE family efflux transporter [Treponema sp.]
MAVAARMYPHACCVCVFIALLYHTRGFAAMGFRRWCSGRQEEPVGRGPRLKPKVLAQSSWSGTKTETKLEALDFYRKKADYIGMVKTLSQTKNRGSLSMLSLTLPLALENLFRLLVSSADTFMLSSYSTEAVAAVGMIAQYIFFLNLVFSVIGTGCSIVLAQYLGAQKSKDELNHIAQAGSIMVFGVSLLLTLAVITGTPFLLNCYTLEADVRNYALQYFTIYGGICCFFNAFNLLQGAILRSYGYSGTVMIVSVVANLINVAGNALSLYGWFGLPVFGVVGVAWASGIAMIVSCILCAVFIARRSDIAFSLRGLLRVPAESFRLVLSVGIPTAGESLSYNISQISIMAMISTLGTYAMSAQVYTQTIVRFVFALALAIGSATQIKAGYYVGAHQS